MEFKGEYTLLIIGLFLFAGYLAHAVSSKAHIPGVTILLITGAVISPSILHIVPEHVSQWFPFVSHIALAMIGFLLGESFYLKKLKEKGPTVLWISIGESLMACAVVFIALITFGISLPEALVLAGIAPASAPAAMFETIKESGSKGKLSETVLGIVAIDDAWGVLIFSVCFVTAQSLLGGGSGMDQLGKGLWEVFGALLVGGGIGLLMSWITRRVRGGDTTLVEAMGFVFICAGLAIALEVSYLLACMFMGATVANLAKERSRPFHEIEKIREPFLAIFFILAGFRLEIHALTAIGVMGGVYIMARAAGLISGGYLTGKIIDAPREVSSHVGWCLLPQAGVALGFALLVSERMPEIGNTVLNLVIATTVFFEITGPIIARYHLREAGEA